MSISALQEVALSGTVICSLSPNPPEGYLRLDGTILKITDYPQLYEKLIYARPKKDLLVTSTTFRLYDFRGRFLQGTKEKIVVPITADIIFYPGNCFDDMVIAHKHVMAWGEYTANGPFGIATYPKGQWGTGSGDSDNYYYLTNSGDANISGQSWVGSLENRPSNIAVNYFIKY